MCFAILGLLNLWVSRFILPFLLQRQAAIDMRAIVDANGMLWSQKEFGGSHDVILGEMFWLLRMPVYPLGAAYRSDRMRTGSLKRLSNRLVNILSQAILIHDVRVMLFNFLYQCSPSFLFR